MERSIIAHSASAMFLATLPFGAIAEDASVNCDTAKEAIAKLEAEKKSTVEQMGKGVTSVMPSTFVLHMMTGTQKQSEKIASGEYNKRIDEHIALIKSTCGIE
jgi:hypothetical protein